MLLDSARWCHVGLTASAHSWAVRHIQLYKVVHSERFSCTPHESPRAFHVWIWTFFSRASSCNWGVSVVSVRLYEKQTSALERSLPPTPVKFFSPPLFSHLICSSLCWTPLCPSPHLPLFPQLLHPSTHPPSIHQPTVQRILYHHSPPLLWPFPRSAPSFIAPLGALVLNINGTQCVGRCTGRVLWKACAPIFTWSVCFLYADNRADTLNYSLVSHRHKQKSQQTKSHWL